MVGFETMRISDDHQALLPGGAFDDKLSLHDFIKLTLAFIFKTCMPAVLIFLCSLNQSRSPNVASIAFSLENGGIVVLDYTSLNVNQWNTISLLNLHDDA